MSNPFEHLIPKPGARPSEPAPSAVEPVAPLRPLPMPTYLEDPEAVVPFPGTMVVARPGDLGVFGPPRQPDRPAEPVPGGWNDPQQYAEIAKGIVPGVVQAAGSVLQAPDVAVAATQSSAASQLRQRLARLDRLDRGEAVDAREDMLLGYRDFSPEQRSRERDKLTRILQQEWASAPTPVQDRPLFQTGEAVQKYGKELIPPAPGYHEAFGRQVGEGLGSLAFGLPVAAVAGPVGAATVYGSMGVGEATQRAVEYDRRERAAGRAGLTQEEITSAGLLGIGPGMTDVAPVEVLLGRLPVRIPEVLRRPLAQGIARIGIMATIEGVQEGGQGFLQDLIAREVYNPNQVLGENFQRDVEVGAAVGGIADVIRQLGTGMVRSAAGRRGGPGAQHQPASIDATAPQTPNSPAERQTPQLEWPQPTPLAAPPAANVEASTARREPQLPWPEFDVLGPERSGVPTQPAPEVAPNSAITDPSSRMAPVYLDRQTTDEPDWVPSAGDIENASVVTQTGRSSEAIIADAIGQVAPEGVTAFHDLPLAERRAVYDIVAARSRELNAAWDAAQTTRDTSAAPTREATGASVSPVPANVWTPEMVERLGAPDVRALPPAAAAAVLSREFPGVGGSIGPEQVTAKLAQLGWGRQPGTASQPVREPNRSPAAVGFEWTPNADRRLTELMSQPGNPAKRAAALNAEFGGEGVPVLKPADVAKRARALAAGANVRTPSSDPMFAAVGSDGHAASMLRSDADWAYYNTLQNVANAASVAQQKLDALYGSASQRLPRQIPVGTPAFGLASEIERIAAGLLPTPARRNARDLLSEIRVAEDEVRRLQSAYEEALTPDISGTLDADKVAAAADAGFDTSNVFYHASRSPMFDAFDPAEQGQNEINGIYVSPSIGTAVSQAMIGTNQPHAHVRAVYIRRNNPLDVDGRGNPLRADDAQKLREAGIGNLRSYDDGGASELTKLGYDHVNVYFPRNKDTPAWVIVFDPRNVRSVNAAFDPAESDSPQLMAAAGNPIAIQVKRGKPYVVPERVVRDTLDVLSGHAHTLPEGSRVGVLTMIEPYDNNTLDDCLMVFETTDGGSFSLPARVNSISNFRAFFSPVVDAIGLIRLSPASQDALADGSKRIASEYGHELTHLLRSGDYIVGTSWDRLLAHGNFLSLLDRDYRTILRDTGDPHYSTFPSGITGREVYLDVYGRDASDIQERMDQEVVAHMVELYVAGALSPQDIAPVRDLLDAILDGSMARGQQEASYRDAQADRATGQSVDQVHPMYAKAGERVVEFTPEMNQYVKDNHATTSVMAMAERLGVNIGTLARRLPELADELGLDLRVGKGWSKTQFTPEMREELERGMPVREFSDKYGISRVVVYNYMHENNIARPRDVNSDRNAERNEEILQMLAMPEGYTYSEIARELSSRYDGVTRNTVARVVSDARAAGGQHPSNSVPRRGAMDKGEPMYAIAGPKAVGAPVSVLRSAEHMEGRGRTPEQIRNATGWFRGPDQKWRHEIDDSAAKVVNLNKHIGAPQNSFFRSMLGMRSKSQPKWAQGQVRMGTNISLPDILSHDKLFKAYPFLRQMRANIIVGAGVPTDKEGGSLVLRKGDGRIIYSPIVVRVRTEADVLRVLMHEIQHYIQRKEKFASGAVHSKPAPRKTTLDFASEPTDAGPRYPGIQFSPNTIVNSKTMDMSSRLPTSDAEALALKLADLWERRDAGKTHADMPRQGFTQGPIDKVIEFYQAELVHLLRTTARDYEVATGEREANQVMDRLRMTPEQRRNTPIDYGADNKPSISGSFKDAADEMLRRAQFTKAMREEAKKPVEIAPNIFAHRLFDNEIRFEVPGLEGWGGIVHAAIDYDNGRAILEVNRETGHLDQAHAIAWGWSGSPATMTPEARAEGIRSLNSMISGRTSTGGKATRLEGRALELLKSGAPIDRPVEIFWHIPDEKQTAIVDAAEKYLRSMNLSPTADRRLLPDVFFSKQATDDPLSDREYAFWRARDPYFMFDSKQWADYEHRVGRDREPNQGIAGIVGATHMLETKHRLDMPQDMRAAHLDDEAWKARSFDEEHGASRPRVTVVDNVVHIDGKPVIPRSLVEGDALTSLATQHGNFATAIHLASRLADRHPRYNMQVEFLRRLREKHGLDEEPLPDYVPRRASGGSVPAFDPHATTSMIDRAMAIIRRARMN